ALFMLSLLPCGPLGTGPCHGLGNGLPFLRRFGPADAALAPAPSLAVESHLASLEVLACRRRAVAVDVARRRPVRLAGVRRRRRHVDAVDRAGRHAQLAAGALVGQHRVHLLGGADDGIDRAGLDAARAADALVFADECHAAHGRRLAVLGEGPGGPARDLRQSLDGALAARRAAIDVGFTGADRLGVGTAALVAAALTLRLRQQAVDV